MITVDPKEIPSSTLHAYLLGAVTPRPIAFASTIDKDGQVNLSPFSFFNCFGYNPPLLIFSPARRGRDNTTKHTYDNILEVQEVVINVVNYSMVQQMSLASTEYPKGVNEFTKSGFTEVASTIVKPPRVKEAPIAMECNVLQIVPTGTEGGAGNLIICEVVLMHIQEAVLDANGRIDPYKLDAVARLGADFYCRVQGDSIFRVPKPLDKLGVGVDSIPERIRYSKILTGNDLGLLGNVERIPSVIDERAFAEQSHIKQALQQGEEAVHLMAHILLAEGKIEDAWKVLLLSLR
ncbi:MAG TPA: flavin reductase family protein [Ohtaekwangia sp.]|uniref:flavin reductase family protein n=1 Tax=Ohtaekwangia sp. TaxID=2066019 RepID=UPI002F9376F7